MTLEAKPTVRDQMKEAWVSDFCPIDGNHKLGRKYFFCKQCTWSLPREIQNALRYRPERSAAEWLQAMQMLKQIQAETK